MPIATLPVKSGNQSQTCNGCVPLTLLLFRFFCFGHKRLFFVDQPQRAHETAQTLDSFSPLLCLGETSKGHISQRMMLFMLGIFLEIRWNLFCPVPVLVPVMVPS